jgi:hypothetical protein
VKLLISPAKKMRAEDFLPPRTQPPLLEKSAQLLDYVRGLSLPQLKRLLACNESLAQEAFENFRAMELGRGTTPALLAYDGIQYKYMAPGVFETGQFTYLQEHLRILSGFYGVLRPFDGVRPYRLEMQAKLKTDFCASMYDFWGEDLARLLDGEGVLLNLASAEYSRSVLPHLPPGIRVITPIFGERNGAERVVEKGVYVKMARGEMVRFLAEQGTDKPDALTEFDRLGFRCYSELSTPERPVFLRT